MDMCKFGYNAEKDLFLKDAWVDNVDENYIHTVVSYYSPKDVVVEEHPNKNEFKNTVFLIKDNDKMSVVMTFGKDSVREAMYKLWLSGTKDFEDLMDSSFKEYFDNRDDMYFESLSLGIFLNGILLEAYSRLEETGSKDMEEIVDILTKGMRIEKNEEDNTEEEKKDMVKSNIVAIQYGRHNAWGAMDQLGPASVVPETVVKGVKPNSVVVGPKAFSDSSIIVTVYVDLDLYDKLEKLLDKSDFAVRFANELVELELSKPVTHITLTSDLSEVLKKVIMSLSDIIRVQALNNEKNAVLYLKNIKEKTEELIKAMKKNDTIEADGPIPVKEDPKPVEPKVGMTRSYLCKQPSILSKVYETGNRIKNNRNISGIFMQAVSELGELGEEVRIKTDKTYYRKDEGKDGILGEACDVIIAVTDLLNIAGYTLEDIDRVISSKLNKWEHKANDKVMINIVKCYGDVGNFDYVKLYNDVNGKEARVCKLSQHVYLVVNYDNGKILGSSAIYEGFDKFVTFVKNCNIGDVANPGILAKEICDMLDRKGE